MFASNGDAMDDLVVCLRKVNYIGQAIGGGKAGAMDRITREQRSHVMSSVRSKNTKPEMTVRRVVHAMGFRYRLHSRKLPGQPDMVFTSRRKIIFVHGCFWHMHEGCPNVRLPKSHTDYWRPKLQGNREKDKQNLRKLHEMGWETLVIWECEIEPLGPLRDRIRQFLDG